MSKKKAWEEKLSDEDEQFINQNIFRIDEFVKSMDAKCIANKYLTTIKQHSDGIKSELYFALRRIAYKCNNKDIAFNRYGPKVFRQTTEEYFIQPLRHEDLEFKTAIIRKQLKPKSRLFKLFNCPKIRQLVKKAVTNKKQRHAFILRISHPSKLMTFKDIGKRLGCNKSNAKKHFDKAVKNLQMYVKSACIDIDDIYRSLANEEKFELF